MAGIASGGFGRIYRSTTNAVINEGIGAAIALETGVARLGNMEAVQFHPTGIFPAGILVTEGCRGDGGLLLDGAGHRFMPDYEPDKGELASRDVVSRCMEQHIAKGKGASSRFGEHLWLDIRLLGRAHIETRLREVKEICQYFLGIDPAAELIPVRPAQHYSMGGIRTDHSGASPHLNGLFAAGEAACWDIHGFNRLGGNSVAETVVAGMIVGETIADFCEGPDGNHDVAAVRPPSVVNIPIDADEMLELHVPAGEVAILGQTSQSVRATMSIRCPIDSRSCAEWAAGARLEAARERGRVHLGIDAPARFNAEVKLSVEVPSRNPLKIVMGYGELRAEGMERNVSIDMKAGDIDISMPRDAVDEVHLAARFGDASMRIGGRPLEGRRPWLVGAKVDWLEGRGDHDVNVRLRYGDVHVALYP